MTEDRELTTSRLPAERAGKNLWAWRGLTFTIVENTLDFGDLDEIAENVQPEFSEIQIQRRVAGPMAGGIWGEAALVATFTAVALPFLAELGKDLYHGFRTALFSVYKKARTLANSRGYRRMAIEIQFESGPGIIYLFPDELELSAFERAVNDIASTYLEVDRHKAGNNLPYAIMEFDSDSQSWKEGEGY